MRIVSGRNRPWGTGSRAMGGGRGSAGGAVAGGGAGGGAWGRGRGPPVDRPGYQVVVQECPTCASALRDARAGPIDVSPEELAAAKVDAEVLDLTGGGKGEFKHTITPA